MTAKMSMQTGSGVRSVHAEKVRIGLIGTGRFGRLHLRVLQDIPGARVVALSDLNRQALEQTAADFGVPAADCHPDPMELIRRDDIDLVDVVTDEKSHGELVMAALKHGKHVIVEKPLCVTYGEASEIEKVQAAANRQVMVGNISRFSQPYYMIKKSIDNGTLGNVLSIRAKRNFSRSWFKAFGNRIHPVYESAIHDIDLILWYAGGARCTRVAAFERRVEGMKFPEMVSALLMFENGLIATLDTSWMVPAGSPQNLVDTLELDGLIDAHIEVVGESATAQYQLAHAGFSIWTDKGVLHPDTTLWPTGHHGVSGAIRAELEDFVRAAAENKPSAVMPLREAVHAIRIADAIVDAASRNQVVVLE